MDTDSQYCQTGGNLAPSRPCGRCRQCRVSEAAEARATPRDPHLLEVPVCLEGAEVAEGAGAANRLIKASRRRPPLRRYSRERLVNALPPSCPSPAHLAEMSADEIQQLKEWVEQQPHLPPVPEEQLPLFLRTADGDLEKAKEGVDLYYTVRTHAPEAFSNRDPLMPEIDNVAALFHVAASPVLHPDGYIVLFARLLPDTADRFVHADALKFYWMCEDLALREHPANTGFLFVFDLSGMSLPHLARLNLVLLRQYLVYTQDALPSKVIGNHMVNVVPATETLINIMKPIMKKELSDKLFVHSKDMEEFYKHVPKSVLPKDYGGELDSLEVYHNETRQRLKEHREWFLSEQALRVDESRRPGRGLTATDVFGMEGSFRALSID
ncbi:alpha-tocopherol transfer protein-like [Schistocerca serialis cubense]|uniref:alpha-tocopherol transfer protein-like n=1 Tax=Schistocerca serialis cubense TaxID=2023355 RepID=UPI00214DF2EA|nr:alpha-tocopherol transfer protein-like [Schistocerca serialis cubense]